jgi:hypothetical protein
MLRSKARVGHLGARVIGILWCVGMRHTLPRYHPFCTPNTNATAEIVETWIGLDSAAVWTLS